MSELQIQTKITPFLHTDTYMNTIPTCVFLKLPGFFIHSDLQDIDAEVIWLH